MAVETLTCSECGTGWDRERRRGTKPSRCPGCTTPPKPRTPQTYRCGLCRTEHKKRAQGPPPKLCPPCKGAPDVVSVRFPDCVRCEQPWAWRVNGGHMPVLCPSCADGHRFCPRCSTTKALNAFHPARTKTNSRHGVQTNCRECLTRPLRQYECPACGDSFADRWRGHDAPRVCPACSETLKYCGGCAAVKPLDAFHASKEKTSGRAAHCRACMARKAAELRVPGYQSARRFGLTAEDWQAQHDTQDGRCGLCTRVPSPEDRALAWDHCHETSIVRMLLCNSCNLGLGLLRDDPALLRAAADYIESYR